MPVVQNFDLFISVSDHYLQSVYLQGIGATDMHGILDPALIKPADFDKHVSPHWNKFIMIMARTFNLHQA